ncbi:Pkinase-domain-containing protein [Atractiella rhizophila]|nr:Pkinase-domain-containing protein [Atractiella rhizophila]
MDKPVYMFRTIFDVSRSSELTLSAYLRTSSAPPGQRNDMGDDVFLSSVTITPDFNTTLPAGALGPKVIDKWFEGTSSTGQGGHFHLQIAFKATEQGLRIEDLDLLRVIGKGSFGKVMQVRKTDTGRIYALKTIKKAHIVNRSEVTHTLAERSVLAKVNNPFITPLKFAFQSPDKLYLVLAFVNGGELFHHLQREGRFSEERSRFYAAELLCALECLHGFNVVYRDLKPENILLDYVGHISLCDFGLCKLNMTDQETTNTFCGTPEYLAPELLLGQGYTKSVDWWTLGVLLYEMLTGLPPYYDEDVPTMYKKILQNPLIFPDDMGAEARSVLTGLLTREPSQRLGNRGAEDIKNHPFFKNHLDWALLSTKKIQPPFKPSVESAADTSNFDEEFTAEAPVDSVVEPSHLSESVQAQFEGFTFQNRNMGPESVR